MLEKFLNSSQTLLRVMSKSHGYYIGGDIDSSKSFFPSKRVPLVIYLENSEKLSEILSKLKKCYGGEKSVTAVFVNKEINSELNSLVIPEFPCALILLDEKLTESKKFDFSDLIEIMLRLRAENGCEWDKAQTHESIRINLIEEAYELVEAIDKADKDMLLEETGDVLLQAVFHTHIEMQDGSFDYSDMLTHLCDKLLTRHTHIFGNNHAENAEQALNFWNSAKSEEKGYKDYSHSMRLVPNNLPSLLYAFKLQKKAAKGGFDWDSVSDVLLKVGEELEEVLNATDSEREMEGGDLLFAVVNLLRFLDIEPELALKAASQKFLNRFESMEHKIASRGKRIDECSLEEMDKVWNEVKAEEKAKILK